MRKTLLGCAAGTLMLPLAGFAQNNEIGLQFGKAIGEGRRITASAVPGRILAEEGEFAGGIVYNRRLLGKKILSLQFQLPVFAFENQTANTGIVGNPFGDTTSATAFVTPGIQVRLLENFPVQPYAFAGVGYARVARLTPNSSLTSARFENEGTWGVSAGAGVDLMFGRHFGIRGEIRSLTVGSSDVVLPGLSLNDPNTRWMGTGGIVFRF
jgi:hypothetical protein